MNDLFAITVDVLDIAKLYFTIIMHHAVILLVPSTFTPYGTGICSSIMHILDVHSGVK